ncbi:hypothetical protein LTR62_003559 [Meristemomyces frigidus]|uniref:Uncharacterized protein n=1 Tax=Meristemomyces frigidus TaxID=1508187 RepID=A0AAN7YRP4_9PEZI|nr:hypothetical protein LTR62_003559 [Meristemomyces frigidus]
MPSARGNKFTTVEVKPDGAPVRSNLAPASPNSPKAVRFAPSPKAESRALTQAEAWSLYHFEKHAQTCRACNNPLEAHRLCETGQGLAQDVAGYVHRIDGVVYSRTMDNGKLVPVDIPTSYVHARQLLKSMERPPRSTTRTVPIISYEQAHPVSTRQAAPRQGDNYADTSRVVLEPHRSERRSDPRSQRKSTKHVAFDGEDNAAAATPRRPLVSEQDRRGSLYLDDLQKQRREAYRVEYREPEQRERRQERRRSVFV